MLYVIADKAKATEAGFNIRTHRVFRQLIILTENEIRSSQALDGSFEERVESLTGSIYTLTELKHILNEGGWNNAK